MQNRAKASSFLYNYVARIGFFSKASTLLLKAISWIVILWTKCMSFTVHQE
jgi:hypothetical protein